MNTAVPYAFSIQYIQVTTKFRSFVDLGPVRDVHNKYEDVSHGYGAAQVKIPPCHPLPVLADPTT
jgi:hypothetical protein